MMVLWFIYHAGLKKFYSVDLFFTQKRGLRDMNAKQFLFGTNNKSKLNHGKIVSFLCLSDFYVEQMFSNYKN